jgi:hypothetical protein
VAELRKQILCLMLTSINFLFLLKFGLTIVVILVNQL